ncbi:hypothetical protein B0H16DRAFT_1825745 [Mycena metata]|uniref:DDE-1 domain-containing protein n=1 Tax=Mycena metata TaxID=1033252 RepID=A0AAD7GW92_9AGAR|nr:hypothetical protein B0H16DRAFT_1825745 [Mycena metata]
MPLGSKKASAARARAAKTAPKIIIASDSSTNSSQSDNCHWDGTEGDKVPQLFEPFLSARAHNHSGSDTEWACEDGLLPSGDESSDSDKDLEGLDLLRSFALAGEKEDAVIIAYNAITEHKSKRTWAAAEKIGYLTEAGAQLEYGKNYEGYWDGTMFMVQLRDKIIPAFETAHGAGYQMLLMVDHSQGHCMYRLDALIVSRMNLSPGGKQAFMRNGWWMDGNVRRTQTMVYPADHTDHPGQPKGIKAVLQERGLWPEGKFLKECKKAIHTAPRNCCAVRMLELEPDFLEQRSMIAEHSCR